MPRDWKLVAAALAPDIPAESVERLLPTLNALEAAVRPLLAKIPAEGEPAYVQLVGRDKEAGA